MCWIEKESIEKMVMTKGEFLGATNQYYSPVIRGKNEYGVFNQALRRVNLKFGVGVYALLYSLHPVTADDRNRNRNGSAFNELIAVAVRKAYRHGLITFEQGCMELTPLINGIILLELSLKMIGVAIYQNSKHENMVPPFAEQIYGAVLTM